MKFRPLRRAKQALTIEEIKKLLRNEKRATLAMNGDGGYPYAVTVNYVYDEQYNRIIFHGAKAGHKYDSIKKDDKVCFTVYGDETCKEDDWAPYLKSVVVFGRCRLIEDENEIAEKAEIVGMKYYPTEESVDEIIADTIHRIGIYEISIEHMTGKLIHER